MAIALDNYLRLVPDLRERSAHSAQVRYDNDGDVLYISFEPGLAADESDEVEDDVIGRFKDGRVIGYTILNASLHGVAP
jgi:uncharacterized protein YuzE